MNTKKGLRYYLIIFFFSVIALVVYVAYLSIKAGSIDYGSISSYLFVPLIFTVFLFLFDKAFDFIFPSKTKKENTEFNNYINHIDKVIKEQCDFSIEGYRRLRGNAGFQKSVEQAFRILTNGETKEISFLFLDKKFKKNSDEYIALKVVVEEVKKMMDNS